jgi:Tol biopolymer transport system component
VRHVAGGRTIALTENVPGHHRRPQWSPDGSQIVFSSGEAIYVVPALGGVPRSLVALDSAQWPADAAWSPDGQHIVYVRGTLRDPGRGVFLQPVGGGAARKLADTFNAHSPSWSPDGSWIAYVSGNWRFVYGTSDFGNIATSSIWLVSSEGGDPVQVTSDACLNLSPVWMPDSRHLLFVSDVGGARDIYVVEITPSGKPAGPASRLTTGLNAHGVSLSADGSHAAYSAFSHTANIWSIATPSRPPVSSAEAMPVTTGNQVVEDLEISPDGEWLAFDSDLSGNQDIYKMPVGGGEPQQLTTDPAGDFNPSWSPDGKEIAFHSLRSGTRGIYVVSTNGGPDSPVVDTESHETVPDWSPDGKQLVYGVWGDPTQLYVISREGAEAQWGEPRQLTAEANGGQTGQWSPDGSLIAYVGTNEIWLVAPPDGPARRLIENPNPDPASALYFGNPIWSLDGRSVYFRALDSQGNPAIWSVPVTGGTPTLLVRFDDPVRQSLRGDFTTDGGRFYFTITSRESDVWVLTLER